MTDIFIASNGIELKLYRDGSIRLPGKGISIQTTQALREYFQNERDAELGRWRDSEDPNMVVYPHSDNVVRVVNEKIGIAWDVTRPLHLDDLDAPTWHGAASRYFAAIPEKKPWHSAQPGEVWVLETELHPEPRAFKVSSRRGHFTSSFTQVYNGRPLYTPKDGPITAGRRIWPEDDQ